MCGRAWSCFLSVVGDDGNKPAVVCGATECSYDELQQLAFIWAGTIAAKPGERVVVWSENSIATAAAVLGIWRCGAVPVWVNSSAPASQLEHAVLETEAVAVVAAGGVVLGDIHCRFITEASDSVEEVTTAPTTPEEGARGSIVYTSGSTGQPKGVVQTEATLIDSARRIAATVGYRPDDRILCPVPFAFDYGWGQMLSMAFCGITLVLPEPANGFGICNAISQHRPSVFAGVPSLFANLVSGIYPIYDVDCSSVRLITNTGSRLSPELQKKVKQIFLDAELSLNYGLTETYRSTSLPVSLAPAKSHTVGAPVPGADIVIVDAKGRCCAPNVEGEVVHRGAGIFECYWNDPQRTKLVRRPDPLQPDRVAVYTGDLGFLDEDGHLVIVGRKDRQMKSMGVRVSPDEVEQALSATGLVSAVAVTSRPDETAGHLIVAFVVGIEGRDITADLRVLKREARSRLSAYMVPRAYHIVDELPLNANGKIDYGHLTIVANRSNV